MNDGAGAERAERDLDQGRKEEGGHGRSPVRTSSQSVARPQRTRFERRDDLLGETRTPQQTLETRRADARLHAPEPAARGRDERREHILAEARPQRRAQVADRVGKAELDRLAAGPVFAGEHGFFRAFEARPAAALDEIDETLVDLALHRLEPLDVLRLLRQERVEHSLMITGGVEPALDTELVDELGKAERAADHADGADDRGRVADDLVGGAGDHVAAGG